MRLVDHLGPSRAITGSCHYKMGGPPSDPPERLCPWCPWLLVAPCIGPEIPATCIALVMLYKFMIITLLPFVSISCTDALGTTSRRQQASDAGSRCKICDRRACPLAVGRVLRAAPELQRETPFVLRKGEIFDGRQERMR